MPRKPNSRVGGDWTRSNRLLYGAPPPPPGRMVIRPIYGAPPAPGFKKMPVLPDAEDAARELDKREIVVVDDPPPSAEDAELAVILALRRLSPEERQRVLRWAVSKWPVKP